MNINTALYCNLIDIVTLSFIPYNILNVKMIILSFIPYNILNVKMIMLCNYAKFFIPAIFSLITSFLTYERGDLEYNNG